MLLVKLSPAAAHSATTVCLAVEYTILPLDTRRWNSGWNNRG
jgi:hypothetical protein